MKENTASRTAQYMAFFRALETTLPASRRLFNDPYARLFLDPMLKQAEWLYRIPFMRDIITSIIESNGPGAFSSGIARTRLIDDLLQQCIQARTKQVIILGAGFDTRALRLDSLRTLPVIEIDHPDTASFKITTLKKKQGMLPENVMYLQLDFNRDSLETLAQKHAINFNMPTTIVWEGVSNYLSEQAIQNTFAFLSRFREGSGIVFTYIDKQVLDKPQSFFGTDKILKTLRSNKEEWTFGFYPDQLQRYLAGFGFSIVEDKSAVEYRAHYMPERKKISRGYEFYRVALAKKE